MAVIKGRTDVCYHLDAFRSQLDNWQAPIENTRATKAEMPVQKDHLKFSQTFLQVTRIGAWYLHSFAVLFATGLVGTRQLVLSFRPVSRTPQYGQNIWLRQWYGNNVQHSFHSPNLAFALSTSICRKTNNKQTMCLFKQHEQISRQKGSLKLKMKKTGNPHKMLLTEWGIYWALGIRRIKNCPRIQPIEIFHGIWLWQIRTTVVYKMCDIV